MEPTGLFLVLAWLQILPRLVSSEGPESSPDRSGPLKPVLRLHPPGPRYQAGDSVTLTCSAPLLTGRLGFQFVHGTDTVRVGASPETSRSFQIPSLGPEHAGAHTCWYWVEQGGQETPSPESDPVSIEVTAHPPTPTLSLDPPHAVYLPGERVNLSCSAPGAQDVTGYGFYMARPEQGTEELPPRRGGPRLEIQAAMGDEGPYTCWYWSRVSGREIPSGLSRPVVVPVADRPGSPSVSVSPDYPAYVAGERVEIRCSAPPGASPAQYEFYETGEPLGDRPGHASSWQTDLPASGTGNVTLSYSCVYTELVQGRPVPSNASHAVSLAVFPAPAPPTLQLSPPRPLYVTGETVTVECLVPPGPHLAQTHTLLKDEHPLLETAGPPVALNVSPSDNGTYSCGYSAELRGRRLLAPHSRPVPLGVIDPPPQLALSVDPTSGAVSEGLPLNITCAAARDAAERRFHFYKDGAKMVPGDAGSEISPTEPGAGVTDVSVLSILRARPDSAGEFTCGYEENVRGRWVPSASSRAVNITVTAKGSPGSTQARPPLIPLLVRCIGAPAVLLLLLLVCLCSRKKALQERSPDGWAQPATHNRAARPSTPRRMLLVGQNPQERGEREEDADSRAECNPLVSITVYSMPTSPSSTAQQRGGNSETVVYSEIPTCPFLASENSPRRASAPQLP